jgi:hypothetical protein
MSQTDITAALTRAIVEDIERYGHDEMVERTAWSGGDDWPVAVMAIANHALPDDDPRKITRDDVEALGYARAFAEDPALLIEGSLPIDRALTRVIHRLAAKLAALLPPE